MTLAGLGRKLLRQLLIRVAVVALILVPCWLGLLYLRWGQKPCRDYQPEGFFTAPQCLDEAEVPNDPAVRR